MTRIQVATLGRLRIVRDGEEVRELPAQPVRCALFLYLALERTATRDQLAALFWPERDAERARRSLNQTLYELRLGLGGDWMRSHRDRVQVTDAVEVDALRFLAAAEAGDDEEAFATYQGVFLDGCHVGGTAEFQSWVDGQRAHLARLHREVCGRLTEARAARGDVAGALEVALRWAGTDPLEDEAHHRVIALLAEAGRRSEALRHYEAYRELIARELEVEPLDHTRELVARIRDGSAGEGGRPGPGPAAEERRAAAPVPEPPTPRVPHRPAPVRRPRARGWLVGAALAAVLAVAVLLRSGIGSAPGTGDSAGAVALDPRGIAVLPFLNLSGDPDKEYFSDGITEDLLSHLARIQDLRVISRTSAMRYKESGAAVREIARELGVRYILEGSVRRENDRVRISAQLIDAASDTHLWGETYDRELTGVFDVQSEIARRIAEQLRHRLLPTQWTRTDAGATTHPAAYDLLLRGREYLNRPGGADVRKFPPAMNHFRQALRLDPEYAPAYLGLSHAFRSHVGLPFAVRRDSALAYARRAAQLAPGSGEAAAALGIAYLMAGRQRDAERALSRALELDPNQVDALVGRARVAWVQHRFELAVRWQQRAVELDPFDAAKLSTLGDYLLDLGDLAAAERAFRRAVELVPDAPASSFMLAQIALIRGEEQVAEERMRALEQVAADHPGTHFLLGRFHAQRGRYQLAATHLARSAAALGAGVGATVSLQRALVASRLGQADSAAALLARAESALVESERAGTRAPRLWMQLHALRGEPDRATEALRRQWSHPGGDLLAGPQLGLYWIEHDPLLEGVRTEPAFRSLVGQIRTEVDSMRLLLRGQPAPSARR